MKTFKDLIYTYVFPLLLISKVIEQPLTINFSPADFLLPIFVVFLAHDLVVDKAFRQWLIKNPVVKLFVVLIVIRAISSVGSFFIDVERLSLVGMVVANLKFIISFLYFLIGVRTYHLLGSEKTILMAYLSIYGFLLVGLASEFIFKFEWTVDVIRMVSLANDPNVAGLILIIGIILGLSLFTQADHMLIKLLYILSLMPLAYGVILTGSRTALVAGALVALVLLASHYYQPKTLLLLLIGGVLLFSSLIALDTHLLQGKNTDYLINRIYLGTDTAKDYRSLLSSVATDMGNDHLLLGVGTGHFQINSTAYFNQAGQIDHAKDLVTHNTFLSFYAENGLLGFIAYTLLFVFFLKTQKSWIGRQYLLVLMAYSLFFNIENLRVVWFVFGWLLVETQEVSLYRKDLKYKWYQVLMVIVLGFLISTLIFPQFQLPFEANGQSINVWLDSETAIYLEMVNPNSSLLHLTLTGPEIKKYTIKNTLGFYYKQISLIPGEYNIKISSTNNDIIITTFDIDNSEPISLVRLMPWSSDLKLIHDDGVDALEPIVVGKQKYVGGQENIQERVVYLKQKSGITFDNYIELVNHEIQKNSDGSYTQTFEFLKINDIPHNYIYSLRAYPLNQGDDSDVEQLVVNYGFNEDLTSIPIGDTFIATWNFHTSGEPYMLHSGFYYHDNETKETIQPYPNWIRQGLIQ